MHNTPESAPQILTHPASGPGAVAGNGDMTALARTVRADLERIFGDAGGPGWANGVDGNSYVQDMLSGTPLLRRPRPGVIGALAIVVVGLAGLTAGTMLAGRSPSWARGSPWSIATPPAQPVRVAVRPAPLAAALASTPAALSPALAAPALPLGPIAAPVEHRRLPHLVTVRRAAPGARPAAHRISPVSRSKGCESSSRCSYATVLAADSELRRAYAAAIRAGVGSRALVDYRNRWASLRDSGADRPRELVGDYADLASDLGRAAADARLNRTSELADPDRYEFERQRR